MTFIIIVLSLLGLAAGSFVNALVFRLHEQSENQRKAKKSKKQKASSADLSILNGRSMCPDCRHRLAWYDLIPLASWLALKARCRYCQKPISVQYPLVELTAGVIFALSYVFWPQTVHLNYQWLLLAAWLAASVGLLALAVYDLRWMLLPNRIIYPALLVAVAGRTAYITAYQPRKLHALALWAAALAITSGIFWVLYTVSSGKWIGYGDVRLGLITGTLLADPQKSLLMVFLASVIGTLAVLPDLARGRKSMASRLPFGPFLIIATAIVVVFGVSILNWYKNLIGLNSL